MSNNEIYQASKSNILDIIGRFVSLKKKGTYYWACCPFHNESTPSFSVSEKKGSYYCFGCGESGDGVTFLEKIEHLSHKEALQKTADFLNLGQIDTNYTPPAPKKVMPIVTLPLDRTFLKFKTDYSKPCNLVLGLQRRFDSEIVKKVCTDFFLGQLGDKPIFFEIENNEVFYGQIMGYNIDTLKRIKSEKYANILSLGSVLAKQYPDNKAILDFNAYHGRRLFGTHLVSDFAEIRIVESQKTALIANIANFERYATKQVLYIATGGAANFNPDKNTDKFACLTNKNVVIVADSDSNNKDLFTWAARAKYLNARSVRIDTYFVDSCTESEKSQKYDIADKILAYLD
jgi:hypothetical protein